MADKIRVGIVGARADGNSWAPRSHIPALRALPEFDLAAICTAHAETAAESAKAFGAPLAFHDYNAMFASPEIDLAAVVVRVPSHYDITMAALQAGKNVYCEWPLGANTREAEEMASLAAEKGVHTQVGLQSRADPTMNYLRELIAEGYVGDVLAVNMTLFSGGILERPSGRTWQREKKLGANTLTILAGHAIDGLCYALGDFTEVSSKLATKVPTWRATDTGEVVAVDSPDNVLIGGVLEGGAVCSIHVGAIPYNGSGWRLEVYGSEGTLFGATPGMPQMNEVQLAGSKGGAPLAGLPVPDRFVQVPEGMPKGAPYNIGGLYVRMAEAFKGNGDAQPDFAHAVKMHKLIDAIQQASDAGTTVKVTKE